MIGKSARILAVDDEKDFVQTLSEILTRLEYDVHTSCSGQEALQLMSLHPFDSVILDLNMPSQNGIETLKRIKSVDPGLPVIILTADNNVSTVVEAMKLGAFDYFAKPIDWEKLGIALKNALVMRETPRKVNGYMGQPERCYGLDKLIGKSAGMQSVKIAIERVMDNHVPVVIQGERGTGKELVARIIHSNGPRTGKPFISVSCGAFSEKLLEQELFSLENSDAGDGPTRRPGKIERAYGGTLFLDDISELPPSTQLKLFRLLQRPVAHNGSTKPGGLRVISATTSDLKAEVECGRFRSDLFYKLSVYPIYMPCLRQRGSDIPLLVSHFMAKFNRDYQKRIATILPQAMDRLLNYSWPGNVRELENVLVRSFLNTTDGTLRVEQLPQTILAKDNVVLPDNDSADLITAVSLMPSIVPLKHLEKAALIQALKLTNYNMSLAAKRLGIGRTTLYRKLQRYRIEVLR